MACAQIYIIYEYYVGQYPLSEVYFNMHEVSRAGSSLFYR